MEIFAWLNPCLFWNAILVTLMALILIIALLWKKESRYDLYLLSIPFFPLAPEIIQIIIAGHGIWDWGERDIIQKISGYQQNTQGMKHIPHLIFPVILFQAGMVMEVLFRERDREIVARKRRNIRWISFFLCVLAICEPIVWAIMVYRQ